MKKQFSTPVEPHLVIFEVLKFSGKLQAGSTMEIGERFVGEYHPKKNKVYFSDVNGQEWSFIVNATCIVIETI